MRWIGGERDCKVRRERGWVECPPSRLFFHVGGREKIGSVVQQGRRQSPPKEEEEESMVMAKKKAKKDVAAPPWLVWTGFPPLSLSQLRRPSKANEGGRKEEGKRGGKGWRKQFFLQARHSPIVLSFQMGR